MQAYVVCELQDKLNVLWAFIKAHLRVSPHLVPAALLEPCRASTPVEPC